MSDSSETEVTVDDVVNYLRITGAFAAAAEQVARRKLSAQAARDWLAAKGGRRRPKKMRDDFRLFLSLGVPKKTLEEFMEIDRLITELKDALVQEADRAAYLTAPAIKESVRELIYQDWLNEQLR